MREKIWIAIGAIIAGVLFNASLACASCPGCELDESEKDAAYFACVKFHKDHKTADDYEVERNLCREPAQRLAGPAIADCIKAVKKTGYEYGNHLNVCATNLGFGTDLKKYMSCYTAESGGKPDGAMHSDTTDALNNCAYKDFRDNRAAAHECMNRADTLWPAASDSKNKDAAARALTFTRQKLVPICTDGEKKAALDDIANCTRKLSETTKFDWKPSRDLESETSSEHYIETCSDKAVRDQLGGVLACRKLAVKTITAELKTAGVYDDLVAGRKNARLDHDGFSRDYMLTAQLDKCATDSAFRTEAADIMACAVENVKAFKREPFISLRFIDGSKSAYATLEAEGKCMTPEDRRFQHKAVECMSRVMKRLPSVDLEKLETNERDPSEKVYLWCEMTLARELGDDTLKAINAGHCPE